MINLLSLLWDPQVFVASKAVIPNIIFIVFPLYPIVYGLYFQQIRAPMIKTMKRLFCKSKFYIAAVALMPWMALPECNISSLCLCEYICAISIYTVILIYYIVFQTDTKMLSLYVHKNYLIYKDYLAHLLKSLAILNIVIQMGSWTAWTKWHH